MIVSVRRSEDPGSARPAAAAHGPVVAGPLGPSRRVPSADPDRPGPQPLPCTRWATHPGVDPLPVPNNTMILLDHLAPAGLETLVVLPADAVGAPDHQPPGWVVEWADRAGAVTEIDPGTGPDAATTRVARGSRPAVLLLWREAACPPRRIVAAVQGHDADRPVVAAAASAAAVCRARMRIGHAVPRSFGERSVGLAEAVDRGRVMVSELGTIADPDVGVGRELVRAWPHEVLDETLDADLLVVGGPRPDGPCELGLTARAAVVHAPCSVLVVPRAG
jgi:hypothetical protein